MFAPWWGMGGELRELGARWGVINAFIGILGEAE